MFRSRSLLLRSPSGCHKFRIPYHKFDFSTFWKQIARVRAGLHGPNQRPIAFAELLARSTETKSFSERVGRPRILKQFCVACAGSVAVYTWAAMQSNLTTVLDYLPIRDQVEGPHINIIDDLEDLRQKIFIQKWIGRAKVLVELLNESPTLLQPFLFPPLLALANTIDQSDEYFRICCSIGALNIAVFLLWRIPRLQSFMTSHFTHDPLSGKAYTMLTSLFSHKNPLHMAISLISLYYFSHTCTVYWHAWVKAVNNWESTPRFHFYAFIITSGLWSTLVSHMIVSRVLYPRIVAKLTRATFLNRLGLVFKKAPSRASEAGYPKAIVSSGLSGAIHATITYGALTLQTLNVSFWPLDTVSIPLTHFLLGLAAINSLSALRGWTAFNHWRNLGGMGFGVFYHYGHCGLRIWANMRDLTIPYVKPTVDLYTWINSRT
ncbi:hypothetical protein CERSUDRAFT_112528 [Gelatoporia subvermispora B]|uniref:Uncharacterized protein n=1 Tax=Ceriporiopsis subvermispora (strain B) TaxID=914234 RepID=M2PQF6_CERS8|nr:hypothetical protein CERSUDRAFT_112528 [Gelatoporia subvermispora B]